MRKLFIPLAKLFGIYLFYRFVISLVSILYHLFLIVFFEQNLTGTTILYTSIVHVPTLLFALVLLFKTGRAADIIRLSEDDGNLVRTDPFSILHTGLILIGIVIVIYGVTDFLTSVIVRFTYRDPVLTTLFYQGHQKMVSSILKTVLGVLLVFKSELIAKYFDKYT